MIDTFILLEDQNVIGVIPEWLTAVAASVSLFILIRDFLLARQPFIQLLPLLLENKDEKGGRRFFIRLINHSKYPATLIRKDGCIYVGDEKYPVLKEDKFFFVFPKIEALISSDKTDQTLKVAVGDIYESGIRKILSKEYKDNRLRFEIELEFLSVFRPSIYVFKTKVMCEVDLIPIKNNGTDFQIRIVDEEMRIENRFFIYLKTLLRKITKTL